MLVAVDSNIVDLIECACASVEHIEGMEAMTPPPRWHDQRPLQQVEVFACYWLLAMAPVWYSTIYTFSDLLYGELLRARRASSLVRAALDVLVRESQPSELRVPDPTRRPNEAELHLIGLKPADAIHVADAIGVGCNRLLTNDRQLRNRSPLVAQNWGLEIMRPSEFLIDAVRSGAPWTTRAPWPWDTIDEILARV